ncbi:MFS transporter permease [Phenylobacterium sp.]|uniref:MFS transporter permease n=1 Tax=Phenylobacterium sp. TaxID=1871053 RepID=UPI0011FF9891|nr:MFS transporter permease [Phenylobacterium sp.]MBC7168715.1 MFS transporter permease [Phenylobacterium sp.]TAJ71813.1 MAG: MFS transporter permease [Phenylobacterium sp.]
MTASSGLRRDGPSGKSAETGLSWAAVAAAAGAVFAWAACCVLPMSLALAGLGLGGLSWIAGQRTWITLAALGVVGMGWVLTWRRARKCRVDSACAAPSRLAVGLLGAATVLVLLALAWQPIIEPWALALIRSARS